MGAGLLGKHIAVVDVDAVLTATMVQACVEFGGRASVRSDYGEFGALRGECHGLIVGGTADELARIFKIVDIAQAHAGGAPKFFVIQALTDGNIGDDARARWMARPVHEDYVLAALSAAMTRDSGN